MTQLMILTEEQFSLVSDMLLKEWARLECRTRAWPVKVSNPYWRDRHRAARKNYLAEESRRSALRKILVGSGFWLPPVEPDKFIRPYRVPEVMGIPAPKTGDRSQYVGAYADKEAERLVAGAALREPAALALPGEGGRGLRAPVVEFAMPDPRDVEDRFSEG